MALLIHSLVHGLLKTRQRTTLEVTLLIKISEAPCQYSTKNISHQANCLNPNTQKVLFQARSQAILCFSRHEVQPRSTCHILSLVPEIRAVQLRARAAPNWVPGTPPRDPAVASLGGPPCLHLRGEQRGKGTGSTWKGFSPVWTSWCRFSLELSTKALPHSAQTWTLGPWVCRCFLMAELSLNIFVQPFEQREKLSGSHCKLLPTIRPLNSLHLHSTTNPHPSHLNVASYHSRNN